MPPATSAPVRSNGLAGIARGAGADAAVIVTDEGLTATTFGPAIRDPEARYCTAS